jgi:hypothetical protein
VTEPLAIPYTPLPEWGRDPSASWERHRPNIAKLWTDKMGPEEMPRRRFLKTCRHFYRDGQEHFNARKVRGAIIQWVGCAAAGLKSGFYRARPEKILETFDHIVQRQDEDGLDANNACMVWLLGQLHDWGQPVARYSDN